MLLNEHLSKALFAEAGIETPSGMLVRRTQLEIHPDFAPPWMCKALVLAGGRGKAGGILRADSQQELRDVCDRLFGMSIKGEKVQMLRIEPTVQHTREAYLSIALSRTRERFVLTTEAQGGMHVEQASAQGAAKAAGPLVQDIAPAAGLLDHQIRAAFFQIIGDDSFRKESLERFQRLVRNLYGAVADYGLLLAEINPLIYTDDGRWMALDAKVELDDNTLAIRPDLERFYEPVHMSHEENEARQAGLSYVELNGWVGVMANGAGLAMSTMDLLNFSGLPAANFMDLGGAADEARMRRALDLLFSCPGVEVVFLNLFGGIVSCEAVARALTQALGQEEPPKPMVVRMDGHGAAAGIRRIEEAGYQSVRTVPDVPDALELLRELAPAGADTQAMPQDRLVKETVQAAVAATRHTSGCEQASLLDLHADMQVLVQGITGRAAGLHVEKMLEYGTRLVAGVTPFKGGREVQGVPVYNTVNQARRNHPDIEASIIFVPAKAAAEAILEAAANDIRLIVCITEGIPQREMLMVRDVLSHTRSVLIGPNTPGVIAPGKVKIGIMPAMAFASGPVAIFSRSGTLTYEVADRLGKAGLGQSLCVGIGGDPMIGTSFARLMENANSDPATKAVVVLGEIGGQAEENLAAYVRETGFSKPLFAFIAGRTAPPGKRLGHAGAILDGVRGVESKLEALASAGFTICRDITTLPGMIQERLGFR